jgi:hypothetical protein
MRRNRRCRKEGDRGKGERRGRGAEKRGEKRGRAHYLQKISRPVKEVATTKSQEWPGVKEIKNTVLS